MSKKGRPKQPIKICPICNIDLTRAVGLCHKCYMKKWTNDKLSQYTKKKCVCKPGCIEMIPSFNIRGEPMKYYKDHKPTGPNSPSYKGGKRVHSAGYEDEYAPNHPNKDVNNSIRKHRLVMSEHLGRPLKKGEIIHHINGIKTDNRIENLQLMTQNEHTRLHFLIDFSERKCCICNTNKTYIKKNGRPQWYGNEGKGFICTKCARRERTLKNSKCIL